MLLYVHGFNSSALSFKAGILRRRMAELRRSDELVCPELPHRPLEAIGMLDALIEQQDTPVALIGSSLGGYYATWLAERHEVPAILLNPAVRPYDLLESAIGPQTNLYTGARYAFTELHIAELRELELDAITPERYLLIVETGDEVLDYRDAVDRYRGCEQLVIPGGDHGLGDFERYLDRTLAFCGIESRA
ncbi:MAG TPA: YqiA/YcfP family alpha/beta fold hydrolase [Burkholderiales bacterium]|nr:YqiA/YcfP family alpha/beta fold hydrolase [Burkholderiales bacterium]